MPCNEATGTTAATQRREKEKKTREWYNKTSRSQSCAKRSGAGNQNGPLQIDQTRDVVSDRVFVQCPTREAVRSRRSCVTDRLDVYLKRDREQRKQTK